MQAPAIETLFISARERVRPLSREETETLIRLTFPGLVGAKTEYVLGKDLEDAGAKLLDTTFKDLPLGLQIMLRRLKTMAPKLTFDLKLALLLASFSDRPAVVVMWAYSMVKETHKRGAFDTRTWAQDLNPWGIPTEPTMKAIWESQKIADRELVRKTRNDNWLDRPEPWQP